MSKSLGIRIVLIVATILVPWAVWIIVARWTAITKAFREWRLNRIRKYALKYIDLLSRGMKAEGYARHQRRQFWRELVTKGRFFNEEES